MFLIGLVMFCAGIAMVVVAFIAPSAARAGLFGGAVGVGGAGLVLLALDWPSRKRPPRPGMLRANAYLVDAKATTSEVAGRRMVELTLDVRPKGSAPFQVKRKFVADMAGLKTGQRLRVYYDPMEPEKVELV